jgi:hypothetical protein
MSEQSWNVPEQKRKVFSKKVINISQNALPISKTAILMVFTESRVICRKLTNLIGLPFPGTVCGGPVRR